MTRLRRTALLLCTVAAAGCGSSGGGGGDAAAGDGGQVACIDGLTSLSLDPPSAQVTLDGTTPAPITFTATGQVGGRSETIAGDRLSWTATRTDDTPAGGIAAGVLTPFAGAGGTVTVTATDGCVTATATVTLFLDVVVAPPADPTGWDRPPVAAGAPTVVYPSDQTRFPRNIYRTLFQWRSAGFAEFRQTFEGPGARIVVYTDGAHPLCVGKNPAAACWEADETTWSYIAGSNAGATVTWTVDALDRSTATPTIRRAAPITIGFSRKDVRGAIFYWSTTSAGVRRANVAAAVPEDYLTGRPVTTYTDGDQVKCVACHVVSRDGKYLIAPVDATSGKSLWITEVTRTAPPRPMIKKVDDTGGHGFATISPDDRFVAVAWGGPVWTVDRATGDYVAPVPIGGDATHPDWSPDDTRLAFAAGKGDAPGGAALATIAYASGTQTWGAVKTLVPAGTLSNLFPQFSPDGTWIAYARGRGGHDDKTAQLWTIGRDGGTPVELVAANRVVSNRVGDGQHQNSQPTWAPPGDLYWVAFNSMREYGVVRPGGTQQIWVAAVDPAKLATGGIDPSYPAFRLQFQGLDENNHRAYWTEDVRDQPPPPPPPPGPDAGTCVPDNQACIPGDVCCTTGSVCDTNDSGQTYRCMPIADPG